jgi:hypothetical protein
MNEKILKEVKGYNGQLELLKSKIKIKRRGIRAFSVQGLRGDKEIYIKNISSIQLKKAGGLVNGFIQFSFIGGGEHKGGFLSRPGKNIANDENTIIFTKNQQKDFEEIKNMIEEIISEPQKEKGTVSELGDLEKLAKLKEKRIITEEEFAQKKKQILGL